MALHSEVSEWDVPIWFLTSDQHTVAVSLVPYANIDEYPEIGGPDGEPHETYFATPVEVQTFIDRPHLPGEIDLMDAWSLYYRGRFGECVRTLVTAIEVVLEDRLENCAEAARHSGIRHRYETKSNLE